MAGVKKRTAYLLIGGAVVGTAVVALARTRTSSGLPAPSGVTYRVLKPGENTGAFRIGPAVVLVNGAEMLPYPRTPQPDVPRFAAFKAAMQAAWAKRREALPSDAKRSETDRYSKELYWVPSWLGMPALAVTHDSLVSAVQGMPVDEYGRPMPGHFGEAPQDLWNQTLGGLLKNPLFRSVAIAALVASGPTGIAVYGAYTMWENRGEQLTVKNVALKTAKAYVVAQCGQPCGVAFEFGVGVASGKSYDKAAQDALFAEMTPEQRAYYTQGKAAAAKAGL